MATHGPLPPRALISHPGGAARGDDCGLDSRNFHAPHGIQMFFTFTASRSTSSAGRFSTDRSDSRWVQVRFMLPLEAASTAWRPPGVPTYQSASTSSCSASTWASGSRAPVTMLITPAGTSLVSSTWYRSVAARGWSSDGTTTTVLAMLMSGATRLTKPSSGNTVGHTTPTTPIGSGTASAAPRSGGTWTEPSNLSA